MALSALRRDFQDRCAYSCQHLNRAGGLRCMEIDHFDPRLKNKFIQSYHNLFLATRHCNGAKGDTWPTPAEQALGLRFLNPCAEQDYGEHIVEDEATHRLVGVTPAGRFHIRMLDLNAEHLVAERWERAQILELLTRAAFTLKPSRSGADVVELAAALRREVEEMIPVLPVRAKLTTD
ncbi:MAG TPA: HNH endonuclease domain-containing protein [Candidatus Paceibacterota bacterium]|nr:HNH endonuclease domain-containing protein [Candidatus Paceibacterota bacterium]HRT56393.1 HNH endonuclease domain-containing protein [Candidatus Paceibacterota bacterium]